MATEENYRKVEQLTRLAGEHGRSIIELAFGWLLAQDGVASVIAGATTPRQVAANAAAITWDLDTEELAAVQNMRPEGRRPGAASPRTRAGLPRLRASRHFHGCALRQVRGPRFCAGQDLS